MKNKLLKIGISFDNTRREPASIRITDHETGHHEEITGTVATIKDQVYQLLQRWHKEGRGALTPEVFEYYANYVDYEIQRREIESRRK